MPKTPSASIRPCWIGDCDEVAESVKDGVALCRKHREQVENDRNIYNPERDAPKSFDAAHDFTGRAD